MEWLVEHRNGEALTEQAYPYRSGGGDAPSCDPPTGPSALRSQAIKT